MFERGAASAGCVACGGKLGGLAQLRAQLLQPRAARRAYASACARIGVDDEVELAREVVDDRELLGEEQAHVGQSRADRACGARRRRGSM